MAVSVRFCVTSAADNPRLGKFSAAIRKIFSGDIQMFSYARNMFVYLLLRPTSDLHTHFLVQIPDCDAAQLADK